MIKILRNFFAAVACATPAAAQVAASDSVAEHARGNRFSVGGYGEAAYTREFLATMCIAILTRGNIRMIQVMGALTFLTL